MSDVYSTFMTGDGTTQRFASTFSVNKWLHNTSDHRQRRGAPATQPVNDRLVGDMAIAAGSLGGPGPYMTQPHGPAPNSGLHTGYDLATGLISSNFDPEAEIALDADDPTVQDSKAAVARMLKSIDRQFCRAAVRAADIQQLGQPQAPQLPTRSLHELKQAQEARSHAGRVGAGHPIYSDG